MPTKQFAVSCSGDFRWRRGTVRLGHEPVSTAGFVRLFSRCLVAEGVGFVVGAVVGVDVGFVGVDVGANVGPSPKSEAPFASSFPSPSSYLNPWLPQRRPPCFSFGDGAGVVFGGDSVNFGVGGVGVGAGVGLVVGAADGAAVGYWDGTGVGLSVNNQRLAVITSLTDVSWRTFDAAVVISLWA